MHLALRGYHSDRPLVGQERHASETTLSQALLHSLGRRDAESLEKASQTQYSAPASTVRRLARQPSDVSAVVVNPQAGLLSTYLGSLGNTQLALERL